MVKYIGNMELIEIEGEEDLVNRFKLDLNNAPKLKVMSYGYTYTSDGNGDEGATNIYLISSLNGRPVGTKSLIEALYHDIKVFPTNYDWHHENLAAFRYNLTGYVLFGNDNRKRGILISRLDLSGDNYVSNMLSIHNMFENLKHYDMIDDNDFKLSINSKCILKPRMCLLNTKDPEPCEDNVVEFFMYEFTYGKMENETISIIPMNRGGK